MGGKGKHTVDSGNAHYEINLTPNMAPEESKTGVTFRGSDEVYMDAHKNIVAMMKIGDRYLVNGVEISILDAPENKPVVIEVKLKSGKNGKANIKIYDTGTMFINKRSGNIFEFAKEFAFNVIGYLLNQMISGEIKMEDIEGLKMPGTTNEDTKCEICEQTFVNQQGMKLHITRMHKNKQQKTTVSDEKLLKEEKGDATQDEQITMDENVEEVEDDSSNKHSEDESWEEKRIAYIKLNTEVFDDASVEMEIEDEEKDLHQGEDDIVARSRLQDENVLQKQKKMEEEEQKIAEIQANRDSAKSKEEKKRKRQVSITKKKSKKKTKKEKEVDKLAGRNSDIVEIDTKYGKLFSEANLKIENYCIYRTRGDGACGANCTALFFHQDETLGSYVRNNVNEHIVKFWPFYQPFVLFPFSQQCGNKQKPFNDESVYLDFLKNDKESSKLWMEHHDLQAICNMYQVPVHILTVGVEGSARKRSPAHLHCR